MDRTLDCGSGNEGSIPSGGTKKEITMKINQRGFANIVLIVLIITLVGVVGYFSLRKSPTQPILTSTEEQSPAIQITPPSAGDTFSTNLDGYFKTCVDTLTIIYKHTDNSWEKVTSELLGKGGYYLDNNFFGYSTCDVAICTELPKPYTIQLVEYKKVGEKTPPIGSGYTAGTLPMYKTVSLSGNVKIDIQYFSDKDCQNKKTFSTTIKR